MPVIACTHTLNAALTGPLPNTDNFIIVSDPRLRNIYQVDVTTYATAQLLPFGTLTPWALAYDSTAKLLYWSDYFNHIIISYSLHTNRSTVIYRDPANTGKYSIKTIKISYVLSNTVSVQSFCRRPYDDFIVRCRIPNDRTRL